MDKREDTRVNETGSSSPCPCLANDLARSVYGTIAFSKHPSINKASEEILPKHAWKDATEKNEKSFKPYRGKDSRTSKNVPVKIILRSFLKIFLNFLELDLYQVYIWSIAVNALVYGR